MLASNTFAADRSDNGASAIQATQVTEVKMATTGKALNIGNGFTVTISQE